MVKYTVVAISTVLALLMAFFSKKVLTMLKKEPTEDNVLKMKVVALLFCIVAFILALLLF